MTNEITVLIALGYHILLGVLSLAFYTWFQLKKDDIENDLQEFALCESGGTPNQCVVDGRASRVNRGLLLIVIELLAVVPVVAAIVSCAKQAHACKKKFDMKE